MYITTLYQDTSGWTIFFTYGVPTGILLVILIFCYFQLWPFIKTRIELADKKRDEQLIVLVDHIKLAAVFNERIANTLQDMNKNIEEIRNDQKMRQRQRGQ